MALSITAFLQPHYSYAFEFLSRPQADGKECLICGKKFIADPKFSDCCPIRHLHCDHIVGHRCFEKWRARIPQTCPLGNHKLPYSSREAQTPSHQILSRLAWWFRLYEGFLLGLFPLHHRMIPLLREMYKRQLTVDAAKLLRRAYNMRIFWLTTVLILPAVCLATVLMCVLLLILEGAELDVARAAQSILFGNLVYALFLIASNICAAVMVEVFLRVAMRHSRRNRILLA
ncbi:hypothetical protein ACN47E_003484 [Coniothyrium glycines]